MEMNEAETGPTAVLVITDGRAGNRAQALGLAEALGRAVPAAIAEATVAPTALAARLPASLWHAASTCFASWPEAGLRAALPRPDPGTLLIGAGRRAAPVVAALARRQGLRSVQILDPQMPLEAFDRVVVPRHDGVSGPNVIETLGSPGRLTAASIAAAAGPWRDRLGAIEGPRVALLLGGPSRSARWSGAEEEGLLAAIDAIAAAGHGLLVTPSRRSAPALVEAIAARAAAQPERIWLWDGRGDNPYPGLLGLADAVLVTADSVNMASEAAATGRPVHVFGLAGLRPKLRAFHAALEAHGAARPFAGQIGQWRYPPLAEADRVAALLARDLLAGKRLPGDRPAPPLNRP